MKEIAHSLTSELGNNLTRPSGLVAAATAAMAGILERHELGMWITLPEASVFIGHPNARKDNPVEFLFESEQTLIRLFQGVRLFDFCVAYIDGRMKIGGPIDKAVEVLDVMNRSTDRPQTFAEYVHSLSFRLSKALLPRVARNFESLDHYDQSAAAYELFLDSHMQYTCGYFATPDDSIEAAQIRKFDLIRELYEKYAGSLEGKEHLDVGCGWGGLSAHFEKHFRAKSFGITNSRKQLGYAQSRYGVQAMFGDFLELRSLGKKFDLITIIGMIEHLTPRRRSQLLKVVSELLNENGILYLQCIAKPAIWIGGDAYRVIQKEVFPGHHLESGEETDRRLSKAGFITLERMDHCYHYGLTTSRWVERIEANEARLVSILGSRHYRVYLGYLAFASRMFLSGRGSLLRYVLRKAG